VTLEALRKAWRRSDRLFGLITDGAWLEQPIALRQPLLFYLGHLPAFAWNHLGRGLLGRASFQPDFDVLFERGIDPTGIDAYAPQAAWPERSLAIEYRDRVRADPTPGCRATARPSAGASPSGPCWRTSPSRGPRTGRPR